MFLEINGTQQRVQSALTQEIELILSPYAPISLAKRIVKELSKRGPYRGMLHTRYFDSPHMIKTSSIVSYGLKPLVKLDGDDSLFSVYGRRSMLKGADGDVNSEEVELYITYCVDSLNSFFIEAKMATGAFQWRLESDTRSPLLRPTAINGLIVCLRKVIAAGMPLDASYHRERLKNLAEIPFGDYKSSQWQKLGEAIYTKCYPV